MSELVPQSKSPSKIFSSTILDRERLVLDRCPSCESKDLNVHYKFPFIQIAKCSNCSLSFSNIRDYPQDLIIDDWETDIENIEFYYDKQFARKVPVYVSLISNLKPLKGKILDIGAAYGAFLAEAQKSGFEITGIELSKAACDIAEKKYQMHLLNEYYTAEKFRHGTFDVISMFDVLEHIDTPNSILHSIHSHLKDDGIFVLTVPNNNSLTNRLCFLAYKLSFGLIHMPAEMLTQVFYHSHHVLYFNRKTLHNVLKSNGFQIVSESTLTTLYADLFFDRADFKKIPKIFRFIGKLGLRLVQILESFFANHDTILVAAKKIKK